MGTFYTQLWITDSSTQACAELMKSLGRRSVIGPSHRHLTPIFDAASDEQDLGEIDSLAMTASSEMGNWAIGILNHDNSQLVFRIFHKGVERHHMQAGFFGSFDTSGSRDLCSAFNPKASQLFIALAMMRPRLFQSGRHARLARILDIPRWSLGVGYRYIQRGEYDDLPEAAGFLRT
jgi:hypothetical protein